MEYYVSWDIVVEANSPREAAEIAQRIQRDPESVATVFQVYEGINASGGAPEAIDLEELNA